jgi:hypothetical protein
MTTNTDTTMQSIESIEAELIKHSSILTDLASNTGHPAQAVAIRRAHAKLLEAVIAMGDVI